MVNSFGEISKRVFSIKNKNLVRSSGAIFFDLMSTAVNLGAPIFVLYEIEKQYNALKPLKPGSQEESDEIVWTKDTIILFSAAASVFISKLLPTARDYLYNSVRSNVQKELAYDMVAKSYSLQLDHHLTERTSDFALALSKNYSSIDNVIPGFYAQILPFLFDAAAMSVYLIYTYGYLGIAPTILIAGYLAIAFILEKITLHRREECTNESFRAYGEIISAIQNYQISHIYGNAEYELEKVMHALKKSETEFSKMHHRDDANGFILRLINNLGIVIEMLCYVFFRPHHLISSTDLILYLYFLMYLNTKLDAMPKAFSTFYTSLIDADRVFTYLEKESRVVESANAQALSLAEPLKIEFKGVSFQYENKLILDDISFTIEPGAKVAIVGETGAGKSTIIRLLFRFYEPSAGEILINGRDIKSYSILSLREALAIVSQDAVLFPGTVRKNLEYASRDASDDALLSAAGYAGLISEENGEEILHRDAGNLGGKISGGERQRVNIARALLKSGAALILDEPTAALDVKTEARVQTTLDAVAASANITTLLVTHRLSTVVNANKIIYLEKGKIAEEGTFHSLLDPANGKLFREQLATQCETLGITLDSLEKKRVNPPYNRNIASFWRERQIRERGSNDSMKQIDQGDSAKGMLLPGSRKK